MVHLHILKGTLGNGWTDILITDGLDVVVQSHGQQGARTSLLVIFLWGWVKNKVYQTMPGNIEELAETIRNVMTNIPQQFLANAVAAVPRRLEQLLSNGGGYVEF